MLEEQRKDFCLILMVKWGFHWFFHKTN